MTRTSLGARTAATLLLLPLTLGGCSSDGSTSTAPVTSSAPTTTSPADPSPSSPAEPTKPSASATRPGATTKAPNVPAGTFIDYEVVSDDGVVVSRPADTSRLEGAPKDFRTFIGTLVTQQADAGADGCSEAPQISVTQVDTGGWARGSYFTPGCGGSAALWAKSGGTWRQAWSGQSLVDCSTLEKFAFPSRVAGTSCDTGKGTRTYSR